MNSGRERKTKPLAKKVLHGSSGLRQRKQTDENDCAGDSSGWSSALDPELYGSKERARKGRDKKLKKSGRNQAEERPFEGFDLEAAGGSGSAEWELKLGARSEPSLQPVQPFRSCPRVSDATVNSLFVSWEELLRSRELLKRRIDTIAAVHGWEGVSAQQQGFLSGVEPTALLQSIHAEFLALEPAAEAVERAGLLLELQAAREQLEAAVEERERLAEDLHLSAEECFQARDQLAGQRAELELLREQAVSAARAKAAEAGSNTKEGGGGKVATQADASAGGGRGSDPLAAFKVALSRDQVAEGRRIVEALERLKVPDESVMGPRELACWHENKKTIMNSLKTLSGQIYSATTRILYEIIQNADDCSFEHDGDESRAVRELHIECSDEALVAFHNEKGFQPKDLYAMCQVGESSKAAGSGKIGRKGIGFKSVFQICERPVVLSPPFNFCFDTLKHEVFGYIVPSWIDTPEEHVPAKHRHHLKRIWSASGAPAATGTLLVCPMAQRVRGLDLMRDLNFDGLSLAFLKNLEKLTFVSSVSRPSSRAHGAELPLASSASAPDSGSREYVYRVERTEEEVGGLQSAQSAGVLKGINVVSHKLYRCAIIQRHNGTETRRYYRLHSYSLPKYKSDSTTGTEAAATPATTVISLAFPVDNALAPLRSADGELVFAYLPVCSGGFGFAINADFELVASRQDVSDSHSGNHVLLGRIPALFVHAILTDPALGDDAFPTYLPDVEGIRKDRSGGGRKWHTLASALHRQTGAWMMIVTEDKERVKRKQVVLRPKHLSQVFVPNSLLKEVTRNLDSGELHFAHPEAVVGMALENCIDYCPVSVILQCIRTVLEPLDDWPLAVWDEGGAQPVTSKYPPKKKQKKRASNASFWPGYVSGNGSDYTGQNSTEDPPAEATPAISEGLLLDVWQYLAAECKARLKQGAAGQSALRLIVETVIGGGLDSSTLSYGGLKNTVQPFRIFPVRGSSRLRLHSEYGVPLSMGLSASLAAQGSFVRRLAERVVPRLDIARLQGVEGIAETMRLLRVGDATEVELEQQLRNCFRFGIATTADPQLWWDSFRYAVLRGYAHGLVDFMPGAAIALPLADSRDVVSSRDVQRLSIGLPCLLGLRRRPTTCNKYLLAIPPSASTWSARVRWELAIVQAFGITYPKSDVERIQMSAFSSDLMYAVAECRETGNRRTLEALVELLDLYKNRMGSLLPLLRSAAQTSLRPEECLLEKRAELQQFDSSCSPKFVDDALSFCNIELSDDSFHNVRDLLESSLGMLRLRPVGAGKPFQGTPSTPSCQGEAAPAEGENASDGQNMTLKAQLEAHLQQETENASGKLLDMQQHGQVLEAAESHEFCHETYRYPMASANDRADARAKEHAGACAAEAGKEIAALDGKALEKAALAALGLDDSDDSDSDYASAEESVEAQEAGVMVPEDDDFEEEYEDDDEEARDEIIWEILERLLGFYHTFKPRDCPWLLYTVLTPALLQEKMESVSDSLHSVQVRRTLNALAQSMTPFLVKLEVGVIIGCCVDHIGQLDVAEDLWPRICNAGGVWLNGDFVDLERCVWTSEIGEIGLVLSELGCPAGRVVAIESMLAQCMDAAQEWQEELDDESRAAFLTAMKKCCIAGSEQRKGPGRSARITFPALPRATDLEMMLDATLPMLLERELAEAHGLRLSAADATAAVPAPAATVASQPPKAWAALAAAKPAAAPAPVASASPASIPTTGVTWHSASMQETGLTHHWSHPIKLCYQAIIATLERSFPHGRRWRIPVPTAHLQICHVVVDAGLNRQLARDATALVVLPDCGNCPAATFFVLRHFGEHCLHPALVPLFIPVAHRQSVGLESPCARVQRTFRKSLRLAAADATAQVPSTTTAAAAQTASFRPSPYTLFCREMRPKIYNENPGMAVDEVNKALGAEWSKLADAQRFKYKVGAFGAGTAVDDSNDSLDQVWALVSEVYERPMVSEASAENEETVIPPRLQDADHWELLMWAAITCAKQWVRMQATSNPCHGSRYQETLQRVRRLVPFIKGSSRVESWGFLAERPQAATDVHGVSRGVLLLRTLFGVQLWGNVNALELLEQAPAFTTNIPTHVLNTCTGWYKGGLTVTASACFAEDFERDSLVLIWEWFLLEVAGAAPPAVLWTTIQEPIRALARTQIRQVEATLRAELQDESYLRLLECVYEHTQVGRLMDEMDAVDEARTAAALREAEEIRREREAAQARRRAEVEAIRQQRALERQERQRQEEEQRLEDERERRARRAAQNTMDMGLPAQAAPARVPAPQAPDSPAPAAAPFARSAREMLDVIQAQQEEIAEMRRQLQRNVGVPRFEVEAEPMPHLGGMAEAFARIFAAGTGTAAGGGRGVPVRRHVDGQTMRESEVKGKLARFLAGMRAYERQQAVSRREGGSPSSQQPLPPVLAEFIAWAGDVLAGEQQHGGRGANFEETARRYVAGGVAGGVATAEVDDDDEEDNCCICLEMLRNTSVYDQLGEPVQTACGHRFHAVCYARTMESTHHDPWCPMCRSESFGTLRLQ